MSIHRSTIINLNFIERIENRFNYSHRTYPHGIVETFVISRRYAAKLKDKFGYHRTANVLKVHNYNSFDQRLDSLRSEPRFQEFVQRIGFSIKMYISQREHFVLRS